MNTLSVLTNDEIDQVHQSSLDVLEDLGIHLPHKDVLEALADAGARVDMEKKTARIPNHLVTEALQKSDKQYIIYGRDRSRCARFGYGDFVLVSTAGQFSWLDTDGPNRREPGSEDLKNAIAVGDALAHIDIVGGMAMPLDIPTAGRDVYTAVQLVKGTKKPFHLWVADGTGLHYILEILEAVAGGKDQHRRKPMLAGFVEPISPLRFPHTGLEILIECARQGLPLCFGPMAQSGATAPATLAGTLVVENAEILAGITMAQILNPGNPVCYGGIPHIIDMRTTMISFGSPEQGLMAVAMTQIAKHYGLPVYVNVGIGDSKRVDAQTGLERGMTLLMGALAGADTFGHMGICGADQAASLEQLIVDDRMAAYVKRVLRNFAVNEDTLAVEVIKRAGIGGNYLADEHTLQNYRNELWVPEGFDRRSWDQWWADGAPSMADWARMRKQSILTEHKTEPLDPKLARELDRIYEVAARQLATPQ